MTNADATTSSGAPSDADTGSDEPSAERTVEHGELVDPGDRVVDREVDEEVDEVGDAVVEADEVVEQGAVTEPAKVMRIGSMVKQLLEEVRQAPLDHASRERLAEVYERSVTEVSGALSPDLQAELRSLALPFDVDAVPSDSELRVAQAQLVGWLEGLFHGIQATLFAQQLAARQQLEQMRQLPPGAHPQGGPGQMPQSERPGTYL